MKFDGFPGEKTILSYKLANGVGWLTTHRLIIQKETHNPRTRIVRYLMDHDSAGEKEIADALALNVADALNALTKLEKKGVVTSFPASEAPK